MKMEIHQSFTIFFVLVALSTYLKFSFAAHIDTITPSQSMIDINNTSLVSPSQTYELCFFSPGESQNRYVGIRYRSTPDVVVWVANRNNPLNDSHGELIVSKEGNLVLLNGTKNVIWSSNLSSGVLVKNPVAILSDEGNLVLRQNDSLRSESFLWQSFDYPTDTLLAGMKLGWDLNTDFEWFLSSWKSADDPSTGDYTYRMSIEGLPQLVLSKGSNKKYRTGIWNGVRLNGVNAGWNESSSFSFKFVFSENESSYTFESLVTSEIVSHINLSPSGLLQHNVVEKMSTKWSVLFSRPYEPCDNYGYCSVNSVCKINGNTVCDCLEGFTPISEKDWNVINLSQGCKRKTPLNCEKGEGFVTFKGLKLPDLLEFRLDKSMSLKECEEACLKTCNCTAYANSDIRKGGSGCLMWFGDLIDAREYRVEGSEQPLYVRLSASEIKSIRAANKTDLKVILVVSIVSGMSLLLVIFFCVIWRLKRKVNGKGMDEDIEVPLFDLAAITIATNNFSPENMIGKGGFGPVYKGNLSTGQEVAIKRLSNESNQGLIEFKNEVDLIAKLQHKNLVALLGCCIHGDERMLIYEYMPNKSLDYFIFGRQDDGSEHKRSAILSWKKNFETVMGVARGLVYLHQDSKLQIVHRDLKASNILLDINMVPKISDFGLARIFDGDEKETRTRRIIGTYGYMSPEYTLEGKYSMKSDVFSFGVLMLEMVSGKRNTRFSHRDHRHNLLGHAWLLWNQAKALELVDARFDEDSIVESQVLRCIHVGLLCVQKLSEDRPPMNSVVLMLANEEAKLPPPKEPGFFTERSSDGNNEGSTSKTIEESNVSENRVTITQLDGR